MSGGFGGGFGGDFDDLLPSRPTAPPSLGNPFEDPFADIGRPQENDPWASYGDPKPPSPTVAFSHNQGYESPHAETEELSRNELGFSSPPSPSRDASTDILYSAPQHSHDSFSVDDAPVSDYRPATPTLPEPPLLSQETSVSPAPAALTPKAPVAAPISPSKAGLFDEPSGSTFGSGFFSRQKPKRTSLTNNSGAIASESRSGSLFSSAKVDPLEVLVSKARSASSARPPAPVSKPESSPEMKESAPTEPSDPDPLAIESSGTTQPTTSEPRAEEVSLPKSSSPTPPPEDGASTPKKSSILPESPTRPDPPTETPPRTSSTPPASYSPIETIAPPAAPQSEETSSTPTPPSRAASESLASSQYPEGSTFLNLPQESPGPGAYARVVSPLDTPAASSRNLTQSFSGLALGGEAPNLGWGGQMAASELPDAGLPPVARSAGWGAVDSTEGWGGEAPQTGWGGESEAHFVGQSSQPEQGAKGAESVPGHSRKPSESNESEGSRRGTSEDLDRSSTGTPQSAPRHSESNGPFSFTITVGDPQKVGDPINSYIVYTVTTKTNSPHYRKPNMSVLRRYSDFLWLFETLSFNKPGIFVPPVPEKQGFGRFQGAFIEQRRLALNNCIQKIANHPILSTDDDFKFFIESDSFALDVKHRKAEIAQEKTGGFLSSITGPKFYETDEWFDSKRSYIDALESQLRGLAKSVETVSKHQAEIAAATGEFAEALVVLSNSDLSKQLSQSLAALADVQKKARKLEEEQSQDDIILLMGIVDEYIRLIGSIRLTFASRIRLHAAWQNANAEAKRVRTAHEKARRQGRIPQDRVGMSMHEVAEAEKRAADAKFEFDQCSRLIKAEMARFEKERIDDFKKNLEQLLEGMVRRQQDLIESFENYQEGLLRRSKGILSQPATEQSKGEEKPTSTQD